MDYGLKGKAAIVVGGGGTIPGEIARQLAAEGAAVAIWDIDSAAAGTMEQEIQAAGGRAIGLKCDAIDTADVDCCVHEVLAEFGTVDILVNGAGGTSPECATSDTLEFFDIMSEALQGMLDVNYFSAVVPSQAVGRVFAEKRSGVILNISSVAGDVPLTRVVGYSNAKAALSSFTRWLAVHMATTYSPEIRVNALAPGWVLTGLNRFLLVDEETGEPTERGRTINSQVPMRRYGEPAEIAAAALFLVSDQASFITGAVLPVDGGFTAFSGV